MKIGLIIYGSLDMTSGGYLYDRKLVEYLRGQGDTVEIISLPWRNYFSHLTHNFHFRLPRGFDVLIEDELNHPSLLAANSRPHPCPVISIVHNLHSSERRPEWPNTFYRIVERYYLRTVDGFVFNSATTRSTVHALTGRMKPCIIATPGGDRLGMLIPERIRIRAVEPGPLRLLFLANVTPLKGLHVLLEAMVKGFSDQQQSAINLDVVGSMSVDKAYVREMQRFVVVHGLSPAVHFHGILNGEDLTKILRQSHVLVIPSFYEGFGIAYLEGMAFGLTAIGTTAGAIPQLITDGENGYLIEPGDSEMLAQRLQRLASNRELLTRLSLNAHRRFDAFPTWDQMGTSIRNFLQKLVDRNLK